MTKLESLNMNDNRMKTVPDVVRFARCDPVLPALHAPSTIPTICPRRSPPAPEQLSAWPRRSEYAHAVPVCRGRRCARSRVSRSWTCRTTTLCRCQTASLTFQP
jgi:hypothetical protein